MYFGSLTALFWKWVV
uniref:Uncharacterized protein n=1 Tax=Anguilla anguilla TaxID=7936 RepID=A0A0E9PW88_ANGAN